MSKKNVPMVAISECQPWLLPSAWPLFAKTNKQTTKNPGDPPLPEAIVLFMERSLDLSMKEITEVSLKRNVSQG